MMRTLLFAALLAFFTGVAQAAETAAPAAPAPVAPASALQELQAFSLERATLARKLGEVIAFERFYQQKKEKLKPEARRLVKEQAEIAAQQPKVMAKCQGPAARGKGAALAASAKCDSYRIPFEERVTKYLADRKMQHDELAGIERAERARKAAQEKTVQLLDEITKQIAELEKMVPASKQKECLLACNAQPVETIEAAEQCLKQCSDGAAPH